MNRDRVRSILGVWAPILLGFFVIVTSVNFYVTATLDATLESWRAICSAGAFFIGGLLILTTYGRFKKAKEARVRPAPPVSLPPPSTPAPHDERHHNGDDHEGRDEPGRGPGNAAEDRRR
jgi:hypothetical protein